MRRLCMLILPVIAGCANSESAAHWSSHIDTLTSGVIAVTSSPPASDAATWVLEEDLRIGSANEPGAGSFGQIKGLAVSDSGLIAVLDAQAQEIRVFDADGRHVATHGRKGGGPGEFTSAFGLMTSSRDLLYVPDHQNARMSVVDMEKGFITSYPLTFLRYGFTWDGAMREDDHIVLPSMVFETRRSLLRIYSPEMTQVDSILLPEVAVADENDPPGAYAWEAPGGMPRGYARVPFFASGVSLLDRSGNVWSSPTGSAEYHVAHMRHSGDTMLTITTQRPPVPVTPAERDSAFQSVLDALSEYGVKDLDPSKIPDVKPAVLALLESEEGDLWVQTSSPDSLTRYDIYRRDGTPKGSVTSDLSVLRWVRPIVRGEHFYAVVTDDLDVQYVVRARLVLAAAN